MAAQEQTERATPAAPAPKQYFKGTVKQVNVILRTSLCDSKLCAVDLSDDLLFRCWMEAPW